MGSTSVVAAGFPDCFLTSIRNAQVRRRPDNLDTNGTRRLDPGEVLRRTIERANVEKDQLERRPAVAKNAWHAELRILDITRSVLGFRFPWKKEATGLCVRFCRSVDEGVGSPRWTAAPKPRSGHAAFFWWKG